MADGRRGPAIMLKRLVFLCVLPLALSTRAFAQEAPVTDCYYTLAPRAWCDFRPWGITPPPKTSDLPSLDKRRLPGDGVQIGQKWPYARLPPWRGSRAASRKNLDKACNWKAERMSIMQMDEHRTLVILALAQL